jgi:hypothetical protein
MPVRSNVPRRLSHVMVLSASNTCLVTASWLSEYVVKVYVHLHRM